MPNPNRSESMPAVIIECPKCGWGIPAPVPHDAIDRSKENRRTFALLTELGIGENERRELAMMLPSQSGAAHPPSFTTLTGADLKLLADWLTGGKMLLELAALRVTEGVGD